MSGSVGALLSRRFLVPVLAAGFFLAVSLAVSGAVGAQQSERMYASWYGPGFEGATTASGEPFDPYGYTAAHKTLPFGTMLEVCYQGCVVVRVNDRGPFIAGRDLDLAQGAADAIGLTAAGHAWVDVTYTSGAAGPSSGGAPPQAEPAGAAPQATQQPAVETADSAADEQYAVEEQYAVDEQYVAEEQYAVDEQYAVAEQYEPRRASPPPAPAPPAPEPAALEVEPLEQATPGS
ncbi:MAG: septal ring lytic transglycosylase RlpA family protein, partial [Rubrobacteraceae bacterium]